MVKRRRNRELCARPGGRVRVSRASCATRGKAGARGVAGCTAPGGRASSRTSGLGDADRVRRTAATAPVAARPGDPELDLAAPQMQLGDAEKAEHRAAAAASPCACSVRAQWRSAGGRRQIGRQTSALVAAGVIHRGLRGWHRLPREGARCTVRVGFLERRGLLRDPHPIHAVFEVKCGSEKMGAAGFVARCGMQSLSCARVASASPIRRNELHPRMNAQLPCGTRQVHRDAGGGDA